MTARNEIESIYSRIFDSLNANPVQQMALLTDAQTANLNIVNANNKFVREALLVLADRIDVLTNRSV